MKQFIYFLGRFFAVIFIVIFSVFAVISYVSIMWTLRLIFDLSAKKMFESNRNADVKK